jgi:hypothetical protein
MPVVVDLAAKNRFSSPNRDLFLYRDEMLYRNNNTFELTP